MRSVARYDYPMQFAGIADGVMARIGEMLLSGRYILGEDVARFERRFASYSEVNHAIGVNSGTDALILALMGLGVGAGDEVVTAANTFHATVSAICLVGAVPVLVDADEATFLMDPPALPEAITSATRAVIPVHLYGKPCPMPAILRAAAGLFVVEDAAQAHGARLSGRRVGTFGDAACFSFHPSKNLAAAGDAGAIVTDDADLADRIRIRRELGQSRQNHHVAVGMNSKLDAIQAVVLDAKLDALDTWNADRRRIANIYRARMGDLPVRFQAVDDDEEHVYHLFQIRTDARDNLLSHLERRNIEATVRYPHPIHLQPAFADRGWRRGQFPIAEALADELLCLPLRPGMEESEIDAVVVAVREFFGK